MGWVLDRFGSAIAGYLEKPLRGYEPFTPSDPDGLRAALRPGDAGFQHNLGQAFVAAGRANDAVGPLERAAGLEPGRAETLVALGMLVSFARDEPGAREALAARGPGPLRRAARSVRRRRA